MFVDSHCHLDFPDLRDDIDSIRQAMQKNQVGAALCISVDLKDWPNVLQLAESYDNFWCSVGVHPDYEETIEPTVEMLCDKAQHPKVVAFGETGLDYFRLEEPLDWQRTRFRTHIRAANQANLPLIVHTRAAPAHTIAILKEENAQFCGGVLHCFTENWEMAKQALDLGFYISMSGIVTFKSAQEVQEVAAKIPLDRLLIETDSPYLAPVPFRGKRNDPSKVLHVAEKIAEIKQISLEEVGRCTTDNFFRLFNKIQRPEGM
ncbi:TatD family hydrolase [Brackiella oedipodis]|uniref:TatD family hydrolase n=1 Tax=Brackiella oedipodis TaxID=124225 RepID=UPI0004901EE2|nr:TatD family hydrolase [Brackiella oedipodis]